MQRDISTRKESDKMDNLREMNIEGNGASKAPFAKNYSMIICYEGIEGRSTSTE